MVWGSVLDGQEVSNEWSELEVQHTIAHKEWIAFDFSQEKFSLPHSHYTP